MAERIVEFTEDGERRKTEIPDQPKVYPESQHVEQTKADEKEAAEKPKRSVRAAVAMAIAGANYEEIADVLHYATPQSARIAVETALANTAQSSDYKAARGLALARLDGLMKSLAPLALNRHIMEDGKRVLNEDHLNYARMFLSTVDRSIKLQGLDAPQMVTVMSPTSEEFTRVVEGLAARALSDAPQEADIMQLEQAPDGVVWSRADEPE